MANGKKELLNALRAGFSFFYAKTDEMDRTIELIVETVEGFKNRKGAVPYSTAVWDFEVNSDPEAVIGMLDETPAGTVVLAKNWGWFLNQRLEGPNKLFMQMLQNRYERLTSAEYRHALVMLGNDSFEQAVPENLQKEFMTINFALPDVSEVTEIYGKIVDDASAAIDEFQQPDDKARVAIIDSARGLTRRGIKSAISYGLISGEGVIDPKVVASVRAKDIESTAGLKVGSYNVPEILGYETPKAFVRATINSPLSKGILLVGPAGTGKTHFGKWISTISTKTMIEMEPAGLMGEGLVGQAENAWRKALDVVRAFGESVLFIDELEKGLSGSKKGSLGSTDDRSAAQMLKFLSDDRPDGCYVVATSNDIFSLPPEWIRAERWDCAPFYIGLPGPTERKAIFDYYLEQYEVESGGLAPTDKDMKGWSGAEIRSVCRIASMMNTDCSKAKRFIIPVSVTMKEDIERLEDMCKNRTIPASTDISDVVHINDGIEQRQRGVEL